MFRYDLLHDALKARGISLSKLSELSGIAESTLKNLIYGKVDDPRISTLIPLFRTLGLSIDEVCGLKPERGARCSAESAEYRAQMEQQQRILTEQSAQIAALSATLAARDESITHLKERLTHTTAELSAERVRTRRIQGILIALALAFAALFATYIWDVRNLHSGLTAFFN